MVTLQLHQMTVPAGNRVVIKDVGWQEFEAILEELGENRATRLAYSRESLEIRRLSTHQERKKAIVGDLIKILLEELEMDCECYGSTTFKRRNQASIEPDNCFYIQNHAQMIGKHHIDLTLDPPPDLACCFADTARVEVNALSEIQLNAYQAIGVPELWCYDQGKLRIDVLINGEYIESPGSPTFADFAIAPIITQFIEQSATAGRSPTLRAFRKWVQEHRDRL
jgi:Uma2 family endonuclease